MSETVVTLAGREVAIRPLTLGQLRVVLDVVSGLPGKAGGDLVEAAARIIQAGLSRDDPAVTLDAVLAMEASLDEVNAAVAAILQTAGLKAAGLSASGEAVPAATAAPSSPASTAPSPPAAAIPIA